MSTKTERSPAFFSESLFYSKEKNDARRRRARLLHIHTADKTFSSCISIERELAPIVKTQASTPVQTQAPTPATIAEPRGLGRSANTLIRSAAESFPRSFINSQRRFTHHLSL
ncbi:hypothetical protein M8J77_016302 [Diaphorina citri]|nr:hypothetical protein M8J77_016302 [Diaphorina citri]